MQSGKKDRSFATQEPRLGVFPPQGIDAGSTAALPRKPTSTWPAAGAPAPSDQVRRVVAELLAITAGRAHVEPWPYMGLPGDPASLGQLVAVTVAGTIAGESAGDDPGLILLDARCGDVLAQLVDRLYHVAAGYVALAADIRRRLTIPAAELKGGVA